MSPRPRTLLVEEISSRSQREVHKLGWFTNFYDTPLSLYCAGEKYRGEGLWGLQMVEAASGRSAVWDEWNGMDA